MISTFVNFSNKITKKVRLFLNEHDSKWLRYKKVGPPMVLFRLFSDGAKSYQYVYLQCYFRICTAFAAVIT